MAAAVLAPIAEAAFPFLAAKAAELAGKHGGELAGKIAAQALPAVSKALTNHFFPSKRRKTVAEFLNEVQSPEVTRDITELTPDSVAAVYSDLQDDEEGLMRYPKEVAEALMLRRKPTPRVVENLLMKNASIHEIPASDLLRPHGYPSNARQTPRLPEYKNNYPLEELGNYDEFIQRILRESTQPKRKAAYKRAVTKRQRTQRYYPEEYEPEEYEQQPESYYAAPKKVKKSKSRRYRRY